MAVGFTDKNGDFRPTENMHVLHSSMLFPNQKSHMNQEKKNHLYNFAKKSIFHSGKVYQKIKSEKEKQEFAKNSKIAHINDAITVISEDKEKPATQKIAELQRMLNSSSRDMDQETIQRIQFELKILHDSFGKQSRIKKESSKGVVTFADVNESEKKSKNEPTIEMIRDNEEDDEPLTAQELAILSSIKSQVI